MKKIGIFYGSSTGTCEDLAKRIADKLGVAPGDVYDVSKMTLDLVQGYDVLIFGTSTWGDGELQDDWYDGMRVLKAADLSGKLVALFGCGDSASYPDTYCDGMGALYAGLKDSGCQFIGNRVSTDGYDFSASTAVVGDAFVGLALDEMNQDNLTDERIGAWTAALKEQL